MHLSFNSERGSWACPLARLVKLIHHASKLSVEELYINPPDSAQHPDAQRNHLPLHPKAIKPCACCITYYNHVSRGEQITRIAFCSSTRSLRICDPTVESVTSLIWQLHAESGCCCALESRAWASFKAVWMKFSALASLGLWRARTYPCHPAPRVGKCFSKYSDYWVTKYLCHLLC